MKITFNGTGASEGFPALFCECEHCAKARTMHPKNFRMRSSCLIDTSLLIDFSADTYARCLYGKIDLTKVTDILFTHSHGDHLYSSDLFKIVPPFGVHNRAEPLRLFGNEAVGIDLENNGILSEKGEKYFKFTPLQFFIKYEIQNYTITPLPANHDFKNGSMIHIIEGPDKKLLFAYDTGVFFPEVWEFIKDYYFNAVILDCTTGPHECEYKTHMGIPENIEVKKRMLLEGSADKETLFFLSHFAHSGAPFFNDMKKIADKNGFIAAYDGMEVHLL